MKVTRREIFKYVVWLFFLACVFLGIPFFESLLGVVMFDLRSPDKILPKSIIGKHICRVDNMVRIKGNGKVYYLPRHVACFYGDILLDKFPFRDVNPDFSSGPTIVVNVVGYRVVSYYSNGGSIRGFVTALQIQSQLFAHFITKNKPLFWSNNDWLFFNGKWCPLL